MNATHILLEGNSAIVIAWLKAINVLNFQCTNTYLGCGLKVQKFHQMGYCRQHIFLQDCDIIYLNEHQRPNIGYILWVYLLIHLPILQGYSPQIRLRLCLTPFCYLVSALFMFVSFALKHIFRHIVWLLLPCSWIAMLLDNYHRGLPSYLPYMMLYLLMKLQKLSRITYCRLLRASSCSE